MDSGRYERVCYFGENDLFHYPYFKRMDEVTSQPIKEFSSYSIVDIIELHNIIQYIDNGKFSTEWNEDTINRLIELRKKLKRIVYRFFKTINDSNLANNYNEVHKSTFNRYKYIKDFWLLFEKTKLYKTIKEDVFYELIKNSIRDIEALLSHKKIVDTYSEAIRLLILSSPANAKLVIDKYRFSKKREKTFMPPSLTGEDMENIIKEYIDSSKPDYDYLKYIVFWKNWKSKKEERLKISVSNKILAKEKINLINNLYVNSETFKQFKKNMESIKDKFKSPFSDIIDKICESHDNDTLIKRLIDYLDYKDYQNRINLLSKDSMLHDFEKNKVIPDDFYKTGVSFNMMSIFSSVKIGLCYEGLLKHGIYLDSIFKWFFEEKLKNDFQINDFAFYAPTQKAPYFEKCRVILPEMEMILKQFNLYVEFKKIDIDILRLGYEKLFFKSIQSLVPNKYIYLNRKNKEFNKIADIMFSGTHLLCHIKGKNYDHPTFYDLLRYEEIPFDNYNDFRKPIIDCLIKYKCIRKENGKLKPGNLLMLDIINDLKQNEVISYHNCELDKQREIDDLLKLGFLKSESTLFSRPEQDFLNYVLKSTFANSLNIRNHYLHGTQACSTEYDIHETNYFITLKLILIIIIKIHDDLSIDQKLKQRDLNQNSQI
ncbi:MAG: hypothetical protein M0Q02_11630 [Candidatus Muirbacterium halophilum]|nr:hypothetical protein [Candidatus Muirbacterium halophilum]MCK9471666.1 hypothetical protein [Bacilli bacterium]